MAVCTYGSIKPVSGCLPVDGNAGKWGWKKGHQQHPSRHASTHVRTFAAHSSTHQHAFGCDRKQQTQGNGKWNRRSAKKTHLWSQKKRKGKMNNPYIYLIARNRICLPSAHGIPGDASTLLREGGMIMEPCPATPATKTDKTVILRSMVLTLSFGDTKKKEKVGGRESETAEVHNYRV